MSPEILTILGMTATILIATWTMNRSLRADLRADMLRLEDRVDARFEAVDARFEAVDVKIDALREALHGLDKRMAGLEGLMQGLREAIVARSAA